MRRTTVLAILILMAAAGSTVLMHSSCQPSQVPPPAAPGQRVRQPAAAGIFYPAGQQALNQTVEGFLAGAKAPRIGNVRGLICPHAGYEFSGQTAAEGYNQLAGRDIRTVVVIAPSHYADFEGACLPDVEAYLTPLGRIPISPAAKTLRGIPPFVSNPPCRVSRPQWWRQASRELPAFGTDGPDTWEHSLEAQLPFLQKVLKDFSLVPIVVLKADPLAMAKVLTQRVLDDRTVIIASSDLSHYYPYAVAERLDDLCARAIVNLDVEDMARHEACGMQPILVLMHLARMMGWQAKLLAQCNSGDTAGSKSSVVGYAAIAFYGPAQGQPQAESQPATDTGTYSREARRRLLTLARKTLVQVVTSGELPDVDANDFAGDLREPKGCFVTLKIEGNLRGCIGNITPGEPLYKAVMDNTRSAALLDRRFQPVKPEELDKIEVEISVLTVPRRMEYESPVDLLAKLRLGIDGVVLKVGSHQATYLPQVWEQIPNKGVFLSSLAQKAELPPSAWQSEEATVWTYQAEAFAEPGLPAPASH